MKLKLLRFIFIFFLILSSGYVSVNAFIDIPSFDTGGSGDARELELNVPYDITLTYNNPITFTTELSSSQKYYVIETWGNADTKLVISGGIYSGTVITDLNSGVDNNAFIEFLSNGTSENPATISIVLSLETNCEVKDTTIIVREEAASLYGFNFGLDGNTIPQTNKAYEVLSPYYRTTKYLNKRFEHLYETDFRGLEIINSEVLLIASHGLYYAPNMPGRGMIFMDDTYLSLVDFTDVPCTRTKFAIFAGCGTAGFNGTDVNLADSAWGAGDADCTFGFTKSVAMVSVLRYMNKMFTKLGQAWTIAEATEYAAAHGFFWTDDAKHYKLYGDSSIRLVPTSTANSRSIIGIDNALYNEMLNRQLGLVFDNEEITGHYSGNCLTYNGYQTTDYYILKNDDQGNVVEIEHSGYYFDDTNVLPILITSTPTPSIATSGENQYLSIDEVEIKIVYHTVGGVSIPLEFKTCIYSNPSTLETFKVLYCTNLNTGEAFDVEDIMDC